MEIEIANTAQLNCICVIESLNNLDIHSGAHILEEVGPTLEKKGFGTRHYAAPGKQGFLDAFGEIRKRAAATTDPPFRPAIHLDAHGSKEGLHLANGELVPWGEFVQLCREINRLTKNNLVVTVAACFGLHAALKNTINDVAPFCILVAPEHEATQRDMDAFTRFYGKLLVDADSTEAWASLPEDFKLFAAEKTFIEGYIAYLRANRGKARREREERLVTQTAGSGLSLRNRRRLIKKGIKPNKASFERMRDRYLMAGASANRGRFNVPFEKLVEFASGLGLPPSRWNDEDAE